MLFISVMVSYIKKSTMILLIIRVICGWLFRPLNLGNNDSQCTWKHTGSKRRISRLVVSIFNLFSIQEYLNGTRPIGHLFVNWFHLYRSYVSFKVNLLNFRFEILPFCHSSSIVQMLHHGTGVVFA